jgi:hypothetical protein
VRVVAFDTVLVESAPPDAETTGVADSTTHTDG